MAINPGEDDGDRSAGGPQLWLVLLTITWPSFKSDPVDWAVLVEHLHCLKSLVSSACVHMGMTFHLPPPGPLLRSLFEDVLDTRVGLDFTCRKIDVGRGELLSLPALRASTELSISADSPVIDSADDVDNFVNWLHSPTNGLKVFAHTTVPLPTHPRHLDNLKLTDDTWDIFWERIFEVSQTALQQALRHTTALNI